MSDVFVARQPIFERDRRLVGYELLYRASAVAVAAGGGDDRLMTNNVLVNSVLGFGLESLTGGVEAWVNFSRASLLGRDYELLDPRSCVIEVLEGVQCDDETIAACTALRAKGFSLALDDFAAGDEYIPFLKLADIVKVSVLDETPRQLETMVARLEPYGVELLAEKVENRAVYELCLHLGFTLFQGHYFRRPETVKRRDLPAHMMGTARLMTLVLDAKTRDSEIEQAFRADPGLSFKLLRIVNSASTGVMGIESIGHAIRLIGRTALHHWLSILFATGMPSDDGVNKEMVLAALERGRFCERLAERSGRNAASASLFLTGLLSTFDAMLGVPMPELLRQVSVSSEVEAALLREEGPYTPYLNLATSYARGEWEQVTELGEQMGLLEDLTACYVESVGWARGVLSQR